MKKILFHILLFLSLSCFSQVVENNNLRLEYVTTAQGFVVLNAKNKADCDSLSVSLKWGGSDTTLRFYRNEQRQIFLPSTGGSVTVLFHTTTNCNTGNNGTNWLSLSLTTLAIREQIRYVRPKDVQPGNVRIVSVNGGYITELTEAEFKKNRNKYVRCFYILRAGKPKEIML